MKKYIFDVHYDMVIRGIEVMADSIGEAAQLAKDKAARLPMEAAECVEQDAQLTEDPQELTAQDLRRQWDEAFQKAKADPKTYRVIVETNEREEETGDGDRYFMIDKSDGCGNEYDRWQVIRCDCAASPYDTRTAKAYTVGTQAQPSCEASPNNVTRWAERMINAGRVVSIYADCY
jgi:hypothetical protein